MSTPAIRLKTSPLKATLSKPVIKIDVVSDIVCPWCYIGKRRLEAAMSAAADKFTFEVTYHPFELNPYTPQSGVDQRRHLADKFGGEERYQSITDHTAAVAAQHGLVMDFDKQAVLPNTRKAHALIFAAQNEGKQIQVAEAFFKAYFSDGIDLSSEANLINVAVQAGLDRSVAVTAIGSASLLDSIATQEKEVQKLGVRAVPFYIFNSEYGVSGAQSSETFLKVFDELKQQMPESGDACDIEGNC